jgi:hypothetical protein
MTKTESSILTALIRGFALIVTLLKRIKDGEDI